MPPSGKKSVDKAGVLGVLCHGDTGTRRFGFDAPGRARPASSRCSIVISQHFRDPVGIIPPYHLSSLKDLQLFAILGISWDQLFLKPKNAGSGW